MKNLSFTFIIFLIFVFAGCMQNEVRQKTEDDSKACEYAQKANNKKVWANYLRKFPQGVCAFIAKSELEKQSNVNPNEKEMMSDFIPCETGCTDPETGYMWSSISPFDMDWNQAYRYCSKLNENGYSDWKLPTIQVLKTIVLPNKWKSKFGDTNRFWSSTHYLNDRAKDIVFSINLIDENSSSHKALVRCVRNTK
ncbi:DUF1566 domain-containing protein [bacterium]|nr:DUF1566 domain-containing protein [bacterium]